MGMKRVGLLFVAVLAGVVLPVTASAEPFNPYAESVYQRAIDYWGMGEPAGCTSIDKQVVPPESLAPASSGDAANGRATQPAPGTRVPCVLYVVWVEGFPGRFCDTMVHEVGHLHGLGHSSDPTNVMTPERPKVSAAPCVVIQRQADLRDKLRKRRKWCRSLARNSRARSRCWAITRRLSGR